MRNKSIIKYQNRGKRKTRFNIVVDLLQNLHADILLKNKLLEEHSGDERFLQLVFGIEDKLTNNPSFKKAYICPHTKEVQESVQMNRNLKLVNWNCAYCKVDIESLMDDYTPSNFVCSSCNEKYIKDAKMVPELILKNSLDFTMLCKDLLKQDQDYFIKYLKDSK